MEKAVLFKLKGTSSRTHNKGNHVNTVEIERRPARAQTETFVIARTAEGYRVCSPMNPALQYVVSGIPDAPHCTCAEFQNNEGDPEWLCKHILAVLEQGPAGAASPDPSVNAATPEQNSGGNGRVRRVRKNGTSDTSGAAHMLLRRSVSPDGRIDSLSVEFACPVGNSPAQAIKASAEETLKLQAEIVSSFLQASGKPKAERCTNPPPVESDSNGAVPARMLKVEGMPTKWGRRLFISVAVHDQTLKFFGTQEQLASALTGAGYASYAGHVAEGLTLDLPCQVITKPSGKYVNIDKVLPALPGNGG